MLVGRIRPHRTTTANVEAPSLEAVHAQLAELTPAGYDLVSAPVSMPAGVSTLTAVGTFALRDGAQEIEADGMPALLGNVPDGWQLLSVRSL